MGRSRLATSLVALVAILVAVLTGVEVSGASPAAAISSGTIFGVQRGVGIFTMAADGAGLHVILSDPSVTAAAASPGSALVAYGDSGSAQLNLMTSSSTYVRAVSPGPGGPSGSVAAVAWSPDGTQVAYSVCSGGTTGCQVVVAHLDGSPPVVLASPSGVDPNLGLSWGPDGLVVAGTAPAGPCVGCSAGLFVLDPTGSAAPQAFATSGAIGVLSRAAQPADSSSGTLAYTVSTTGQAPQIFLGSLAAGASAAYRGFSGPAWSPDGRSLAFTNGYQVFEAQPAAGGPPQPIATFNAYGITSLSWVPDQPPAPACSVGLPAGSVQGLAATPDGLGYWIVDAYGAVSACGTASDYGGLSTLKLNQPVLGLSPSPDGAGYRLVAYDGGVFNFGDAQGQPENGSNGPVSLGGMKLAAPIWSIMTTSSGLGYWLVGTDGGVFCFGDATFYGSAAAFKPAHPIVGAAETTSGHGYRLVTSDGTVFAFGDAKPVGASHPAALTSRSPVVAIATDPAVPGGYWLTAADGTTYAVGGAPSLAAVLGHPAAAIKGIAAAPDGGGFWLVDQNGNVYPAGDASSYGNAN